MNSFFRKLRRSWRLIPQWLGRRYRAEIVENDLPEVLQNYRLYIVEESSFQERAAMVCPCGCQKTLFLNLLEDERPCWRVRVAPKGEASLSPSVWRKTGCESHFWLRQGKVKWCP